MEAIEVKGRLQKQAQICAEGCEGVNLSLLTVSGGREVIEFS